MTTVTPNPSCQTLGSVTTAVETFLEYWSHFKPSATSFVHPKDAGSSYLADFELSLLPIPFVGNLREAECIILMLNPGLDSEEIAWEKKPEFRHALERNLLQYFPPESYPNIYLDPAFSQHPGAGYWAKSRKLRGKRDSQKLCSVIHALAHRDNVPNHVAQAHVARKVAIVQLVPYHSAKLHRRDALSKLHSAHQARSFVHALIGEGSKLVIAARSVSEWGFAAPQRTGRLVVYKPSLGASASLTCKSEGGLALLQQLSPVTA
jgi:hypothetical protein